MNWTNIHFINILLIDYSFDTEQWPSRGNTFYTRAALFGGVTFLAMQQSFQRFNQAVKLYLSSRKMCFLIFCELHANMLAVDLK